MTLDRFSVLSHDRAGLGGVCIRVVITSTSAAISDHFASTISSVRDSG
jgi:hypothetical protein